MLSRNLDRGCDILIESVFRFLPIVYLFALDEPIQIIFPMPNLAGMG